MKAILIFLVIVCEKVAPVQVRRAGPSCADPGSRISSRGRPASLDCPGDPDRGPRPTVISSCPGGDCWKSFSNVRERHLRPGRGVFSSRIRYQGARFSVRGSPPGDLGPIPKIFGGWTGGRGRAGFTFLILAWVFGLRPWKVSRPRSGYSCPRCRFWGVLMYGVGSKNGSQSITGGRIFR